MEGLEREMIIFLIIIFNFRGCFGKLVDNLLHFWATIIIVGISNFYNLQ